MGKRQKSAWSAFCSPRSLANPQLESTDQCVHGRPATCWSSSQSVVCREGHDFGRCLSAASAPSVLASVTTPALTHAQALTRHRQRLLLHAGKHGSASPSPLPGAGLPQQDRIGGSAAGGHRGTAERSEAEGQDAFYSASSSSSSLDRLAARPWPAAARHPPARGGSRVATPQPRRSRCVGVRHSAARRVGSLRFAALRVGRRTGGDGAPRASRGTVRPRSPAPTHSLPPPPSPPLPPPPTPVCAYAPVLYPRPPSCCPPPPRPTPSVRAGGEAKAGAGGAGRGRSGRW